VRYEDAQREFEKKFITRVLMKADGNLCEAADMLGMHRNTLSRKIAEYHLRRPA
jgi:Fis family transcriptional regulator, factor for inversion stimulation protein